MIWIELMSAAFAASLVAAVTGFGGAAILLPVLVAFFGIRDAVPILTIAQLIGNGSRVWFNRTEVSYPVVGWFTLGAVPAALIGGVLFSRAPLPLLMRSLGAFLILTVVWRRLRKKPIVQPTLKSFSLIGAVFSFLSAIMGSVGPLMAPFFLAYGLMKGAYIGTEAMATVVMHISKLFAYGGTEVLNSHQVTIGLTLGPIMILGSRLGKSVLDRLPEALFALIVEVVLVTTGLGFLIRG